MPPVKCMNCMDAGYAIVDGVPRACGSCDIGRDYAANGGRKIGTVARADANPMLMPPGGDVIVTEMKRQAAGLPVGVIGTDVLVRAHVEAQPLVHELVRALSDLTRDVPDAHPRALDVLERLPEWALPDDLTDPEAEDAPSPPATPALVGAAPAKPTGRERKRGGQHPAAPLEPPEA